MNTNQTVTGQKTFTAQAFVQSNGLDDSPASGAGESGLGLFYSSDRSMVTDGDLWLISQSSFSQARRFAILEGKYERSSSPKDCNGWGGEHTRVAHSSHNRPERLRRPDRQG